MLSLREMSEKRALKLDDAQKIIDAAAGRDLNDEERSNFDGIMKEADTLGGDIQRYHALQEARRQENGQSVTGDLLGMSEKEIRQFSFVRLIHAEANRSDPRARDAAGFELEACAEAAKLQGRTGRNGGFVIPTTVGGLSPGRIAQLERGNHVRSIPADVTRRDLTVGTTTAGGHLVSTDLRPDLFIDMLINRLALTSLGITRLTDLRGNVAIPRKTGGATAYWLAESGAPTESQLAVDQVTLSPKTVGAYTDFSRLLILQSSKDVERLVKADLAECLGLAIDKAGITGRGATTYNEPTGILNTTGIGAVAGGDNGAAATWANIIGLESEVAIDNADIGSLAYLTNAKVRGKLKTTTKSGGTDAVFIWDTYGAQDTVLNGYRCVISNQVPSNLTKGTSSGVASAILFGNWADLVIGLWGGLDLLVDPYTGSTSGTVRVVAFQSVDFAVRHAESFAAMKDALTA